MSWSISGGALQAQRTATSGGGGAAARSTDLNMTDFGYVQLSFNAIDITTADASNTQTIGFYIGNSLLGTTSGTPTNSNVYARFGIQLSNASTEAWTVRDMTNAVTFGTTYTGAQTITFVFNNTGSSMSYSLGSSINSATLANDSFDLWVGNTRAFASSTVQTPSMGSGTITDFKLLVGAGGSGLGTAQFDNLTISSISAVPEPSTYAAILGGIVLAGAIWHRRQQRGKS